MDINAPPPDLCWYALLRAADPIPPDGQPYGLVQWKGTDVCIDVHCACGRHEHVDAQFMHAFRCPGCGALYALASVVRLVPLPEECAVELEGLICPPPDGQ